MAGAAASRMRFVLSAFCRCVRGVASTQFTKQQQRQQQQQQQQSPFQQGEPQHGNDVSVNVIANRLTSHSVQISRSQSGSLPFLWPVRFWPRPQLSRRKIIWSVCCSLCRWYADNLVSHFSSGNCSVSIHNPQTSCRINAL